MRTCLDGVERALAAAQDDHFDRAVLELRFVAQPCRTALSRSPASSGYALVDANFPDPFVVAHDGEYFAYATNGGGGSVQLARGRSLGQLRLSAPALSQLPAWGAPNKTWAPSVLPRAGYWVMYYSVQDRRSGGTCISRAVAFSPAGPFTDTSTGPFLCQSGGSIDPSPFVDADGTPWLVWKAEQFFSGGTRTIYSQQLTPDGLGLVGPAVPLIHADQGWETGVVEGPSMVLAGDRHLLLYSGGNWNSAGYAVGYAVCDGPAGPCTKPMNGPVFRGGDGLSGTGGQEPFVDLYGKLRMVFHGWAGAEIGYPNPRRAYLADLDLSGTAPRATRVRIGG
jgi:beta-xylosidase